MNIKRNAANCVVKQLIRIKQDLDVFGDPESKAGFLVALDELIARLNTIRLQLTNRHRASKLTEIARPLEQVIDFLEYAKNDELLGSLLSDSLDRNNGKSKPNPVDIAPDLKNDQIRELLTGDLSKQEIKAIAAQRGISFGKKTEEEVKRELLRSLDRQEGYERLASSRSTIGMIGAKQADPD